MNYRLLIIVLAGLMLIGAPAAFPLAIPHDGVACGMVRASNSQGAQKFRVRAIGISCGLAKMTTRVWTLNECGSSTAQPGNRVIKRQGFECVISVAFDPGSSKALYQQRTYVFDCRTSVDVGFTIVRCTYLSGTRKVPLFAVSFVDSGG